MPTIAYIEKNFKPDTMTVIYQTVDILNEYRAQGYKSLTLRQLYYQFVSRGIFPDDRRWRWTGTKWVRDPKGTRNAEPNYKWLGTIVNKGRLAGHIDWKMMEDRTRKLERESAWENPMEFMDTVDQYHLDRWANQEHRPELWIEKDALTGIIEPVCKRLDVPYFACKGYTSQSAMWMASQRLLWRIENGQMPYIFHMGDHDPSGIDMTHDIMNRLELFLLHEDYRLGEDWQFKRIALSMEQIREFDPPSDPAKMGDSRFKEYQKEYGDESWELDALSPSVMTELITEHIEEITDDNDLYKVEQREKKHKEVMQEAIDNMEFKDDDDEEEE